MNLAEVEGGGRNYLPALWVLILTALALRLICLGCQALWWDEGWSLFFATTDVSRMLELTAVDIHPPFYYLLLHLCLGILGSSVFSARLLSVLIGTATIPLLYVTGRRLLGEKGGLLAAFLLSISPFHVYYSQEVRMYVLVTLLGLTAFYFALREEWIGEKGAWWVWPGYVLTATAALYTQYYAAFLFLALNLSGLLRWLQRGRSRRQLILWLSAQVAVVLLTLPWLWYASGRLLTYVQFKVGVEQDPSLGLSTYMGRHLAAFNWGHAEGLLADWWWLGLLPLAMLVLSIALLLRSKSGRASMGRWTAELGHWPLVILLVVFTCGFLVNVAFPFNPPRSGRLLLLALPAYLLLISAALVALWRHSRLPAVLCAGSFVVAGILSLCFFYSVPRYADDDPRPLVNRLRALALPTDAIVCIHPWQAGYLQAYVPAQDAGPTLVLTPREVLPSEHQLWSDDPRRMANELDALLAKHGRVWLFDYRAMGRVLESQIEAYLTEHAYPVLSEWHGPNTVLSLFAAGDPPVQPVTAQFGEWLSLDGAALGPGPVQAGWGVVPVDLTWRLVEQPGEQYHVSLRLSDRMGHLYGQRDGIPGGGLHHFSEWTLGRPFVDHHGLLVPAGTPPGDYQITLRVYRSRDVAVVPVLFEGGGGGEMVLGTVGIARPETPPPAEALAVAQPLHAEFADRLRLLGFGLRSDSVLRPGEAVQVDLYWQALTNPAEDFLPRLQLVDRESAGGQSLAELTEKPVAGSYPTAWWRTGELVRDPHALPIPATVPAGRYGLALSLIRATDGSAVEIEAGEYWVELAQIEVQGRGHRFQPTSPAHSWIARFGPSVELTGYDLREAVRAPGSQLEVTLHWHALETPDKGYHTFVHLLSADDEIVAQHDGSPGEGELPALGWLPGEYLTDTHLLQLPIDLPDGDYQLGVGLYDPATGQRLGDRLLLDRAVPVNAELGCRCR